MATLMRRAPLQVVGRAKCPAALPIYGASAACAGIVCRVMELDRSKEAGHGYSPAQHALSRDGDDGVLLTAKSDPSTIERMCCADRDVPVLDHDEKPGGRDSYTYCPVFQAEKERIWAGRDLLAGGGVAPESVSSYDEGALRKHADRHVEQTVLQNASVSGDGDDPWSQARRDLDLLTEG